MGTVYSHPPTGDGAGVELLDHMEDVAARVVHVVDEHARTPTDESLRRVVETLAYVHDFGKATTFFQSYLRDSPPDDDRLRHHAPLGAFAAYYALERQGFTTETCLAGFVAVAKHHGRLPAVAEYIYSRSHRPAEGGGRTATDRQRAVAKQLRDIREHAPTLAATVFENATGEPDAWKGFSEDFLALLDRIETAVGTSGTMPGVDRQALSESCYGLVLRCWSALVLVDKTSAAGATNASSTYRAELPSSERLEEYVSGVEADVSADPDGNRSERLNHHRSRARDDVLANAAAFAEAGGGVATLTLPTGMGKTLTGLSAAFDIRDRLDGERVVYALPFTSIIDQVVDELEDIYETDTSGRLLTAHHHLAETTIRDDLSDEVADRSDDVAAMLAESWRAGLTVTTFVQLFESLAGPGNQQSMKLPALRDSVIVLDEPQSLPLDWWKLVPRLVSMLTEQYGATVIAMTATQPELFTDATQLLDDPDSYFEAVERVTYQLDESAERYVDDGSESTPKSYADAAAEIRAATQADDASLAVCNTIESARELTDAVRRTLPSVTDVGDVYGEWLRDAGSPEAVDSSAFASYIASTDAPALLHLSTRLRPVDRLWLIEMAKELTQRDCAFVLVSTQLVEAGVDISFDRVYRDLAPIDSIVQAAGRCNRSFERDRGRVTVWWLGAPGDQQKTPAAAVYNRGTTLLPVTAAALRTARDETGELTEAAVASNAVEAYYQRLHADRDVGAQEYAEYVDDAKADELGRLSLVGRQRTVDLLVIRTEADREIVDDFVEAAASRSFDELDRLRDETKPLRVSVPVYREDSDTAEAIGRLTPVIGDGVGDDRGLRRLDTREQASFFEATTGFVVPESTVDYQFL